MSELVDRQHLFLQRMIKVIAYATACGFKVTLGEAERTKEQAAIYAKQGNGIADSDHLQRLALDLNFYGDGKLVNDRVRLVLIGKFAEYQGLRWGGRFTKYDDSRHFEE